MARHDDGEKIGKARAQHVMRRQHGFVFAGMGLGRQQHRPRRRSRLAAPPARASSQASGGASAFRLPTTRTLRAPRPRKRAAISSSCASTTSKAPSSALRRVAAPGASRAAERSEMRALTSASLHAARRGLQDQVGPEIGFHEQAGIRLPVIQKARHRAGRVQRHELMDGALAAGAPASSWRW